jgi:hypothetical protein
MLAAAPVSADADNDLADDAAPMRAYSTQSAIDFGAPRAAAETLHKHFAKATDRLAPVAPFDADDSVDDAVSDADAFQLLPDLPGSPRRTPACGRRARPTFTLQLIGYIVGGLVGLALGYYALRWLRPELELPPLFQSQAKTEAKL